jgi:hypothetical protein
MTAKFDDTILDDDVMPVHTESHIGHVAGVTRMAQERRRTKVLLYIVVVAGAALVAKQTTSNISVLTNNKSSRYLPESTLNKEEEDELDEVIDPSSLFVPSLDFRIMGISQYDRDYNFPAHIYCAEFAKDLTWEWWQLGEKYMDRNDGNTAKLKGTKTESSVKNKSTSKRLMIGVYSGYDDYAKLLEQSVWSARVYGQTWGRNVTVVTLQGTSFAPHGCKPTDSSLTTLNKIRLLFHAIDNRDKYDQVLLLDPDAFVYNMEVDLTTLMDEKHHLMAAQPLSTAENGDLWSIHSSATLWNLNHPYVASVAIDWFDRAKQSVVHGTYTNDQEFLQYSLREHLEWQQQHEKENQHDPNGDEHESCMVMNFRNHEFDFAEGSIVKHFVNDKFVDSKGGQGNLTFPSINLRLQWMQDAAKDVCFKHPKECNAVMLPEYQTS